MSMYLVNFCFSVAIAVILLFFKFIDTREKTMSFKKIILIAIICYPWQIGNDVYSLLGGKNTNGSVYSFVSVYQDAKNDSGSFLGLGVQIAENNVGQIAGISLYQEAGNDAIQFIGISLTQIAKNDAVQLVGISFFQTSEKLVFQLIGISFFQVSRNLAAQIVGISLFQKANDTEQLIGISLSQNANRDAMQLVGVSLHQKAARNAIIGFGIPLYQTAGEFSGISWELCKNYSKL